jgi:hypothetical protein
MDKLPPAPPRRITLSEVPHYIRCKYCFDVTRQTVYNWAKVGIKGEKLRISRMGRNFLTTKEWIDEFLDRVEIKR